MEIDLIIHPLLAPELKHGLGGPLIKNIWQQPAPKPLATAPGSAISPQNGRRACPVFLVPLSHFAWVETNPLLQIAQLGVELLRKASKRTANCSIA